MTTKLEILIRLHAIPALILRNPEEMCPKLGMDSTHRPEPQEGRQSCPLRIPSPHLSSAYKMSTNTQLDSTTKSCVDWTNEHDQTQHKGNGMEGNGSLGLSHTASFASWSSWSHFSSLGLAFFLFKTKLNWEWKTVPLVCKTIWHLLRSQPYAYSGLC